MKIKSIASYIFCVALILSFACGPVSAVPSGEKEAATPVVTETTIQVADITYEKVAENSYNALYLDKASGNIIVRNVDTGNLWISAPDDEASNNNSVGIEKTNVKSPLVIEYIYSEKANATDSANMEKTNTQIECSESDIVTEQIENGVKVTFNIEWLGVSIPVEYVLDGKQFKASILYNELVEGTEIYIIHIKLLPGFGAATMNENGYLVVPDGSGAVINFNNGSGANEYIANVYGSEINTLSYLNTFRGERILMPIFGIVRPDRALLGIITEGDDSAAICAYSASEKKYGYNMVSAKTVMRYNSQVSMFGTTWEGKNVSNWSKTNGSDKFTVSYYFLGADKASYQGIASAYQQHLVDNGILKKNENKPSMHLDVYHSIDKTTAFLGFKYQEQVSLTTYDETRRILEALKTAGVNNITAELIGWGNTGVSNEELPSGVSHLSNIGGGGGYGSLSSFAKENGLKLTADSDFVYAQDIKRSNSIQTYFNKIVYKHLYRNSVFTERRNTAKQIANPDRFASAASSFLGSYGSMGLGSISMDSVGEYFYTNFTRKGAQYKSYLIKKVKETLEAYNKAGYKVSIADAPAYTFKYIDTVTAAPIGSSCYEMFDYDIPLYQLVLHGYITVTTESLPQTIDEELTYLWAVSTGTEPMYNTIYQKASILQETEYDYLYSSTFDWWKDEAIEKYKNYAPLLERIYNQPITGYTELLPNVVETVYAGGIQVYVNYNSTEQTVNGIKIAPKSYVWIGGDSE
ncbi:MAG: hypothetical protein IKL62_05725 [Clostridia bacterium]|nr:hypothetical protein [Clostridia bacterium]